MPGSSTSGAVRVPSLGQSATDATIVTWEAKAGDSVRAGDVLAVVETDKTTVEVVAPTDGILGPHLVDVGTECPIGTLIAEVLTDPGVLAPDSAPMGPESGARSDGGRVAASPKARRRASELGVDLAGVTGTGPDGMVVEEDVEAAAGGGTGEAAARWRGRPVRERRPLTAVQRVSARRTTQAWTTAPHFVQMVDADVTDLAALRRQWKTKGGPLAGVTWTAVLVAALARALADHPHLNAAVDGDHLVIFDAVNIAVAVDTADGLLVPVLADADRRPLPDLAEALTRASATGRGDDAASTATVSNLGSFGIRAGTPVLNTPEAVLLFAGAVEERVVAVDGQPVVRTMVTLSIAFDHRVADGATAARFTAAVRDRLEQPTRHL
jgi:pyruvate/2-oxoglutarate dehydrogenase complex dihydrolipoamide acyltransferase (E2) component